jgi:hypothetical protein
MKRSLMSVILVVGMAVAASAQKVEVTPEFIDSANKSFMEVVLLRRAVDSQERALKAQDELIAEKEKTNKLLLEQLKFYRELKCDQTSFFFGLIKNKRCH